MKASLEKALETKAGKYALNKKKGMKRKEAALAAGIPDMTNISKYEASGAYAVVERHFADVIVSKMPIEEVMIYDSLGKLVTAKRFSNSLLEVNIPFDYSNGLYLVVFKTENGIIYQSKFIKF
jgi:hypothetical protein